MLMSKNLLAFFLDDLKIVRVLCRHKMDDQSLCGGIVEIPIEKLSKIQECPVCQRSLKLGTTGQAFRDLANAITNLQKDESVATLEFITEQTRPAQSDNKG